MRCLAYRTLLLDEPVPGYGELLASFVESGRPFLSEASVEAVARAPPDTQHLEALRRRLLGYRQDLAWPVARTAQSNMKSVRKAGNTRRGPAFISCLHRDVGTQRARLYRYRWRARSFSVWKVRVRSPLSMAAITRRKYSGSNAPVPSEP